MGREAQKENKMARKIVYEISTKHAVEVIDVNENECPTDGLEYDWELYAGTYSPAFGTVGGLVFANQKKCFWCGGTGWVYGGIPCMCNKDD
jgi:hypothetical protein